MLAYVWPGLFPPRQLCLVSILQQHWHILKVAAYQAYTQIASENKCKCFHYHYNYRTRLGKWLKILFTRELSFPWWILFWLLTRSGHHLNKTKPTNRTFSGLPQVFWEQTGFRGFNFNFPLDTFSIYIQRSKSTFL